MQDSHSSHGSRTTHIDSKRSSNSSTARSVQVTSTSVMSPLVLVFCACLGIWLSWNLAVLESAVCYGLSCRQKHSHD